MRVNKILVVGGYGQVGRAAARALAGQFPGRVVVAGRDAIKAEVYARSLGGRVGWCTLDVSDPASWPSALKDAKVVLVCTEQTDARFAAECLGRGLHYVDVSASDDYLVKVEALDPLARRSGATGVLSVGLAPGLTNLLVKHAQEMIGRLDKVDITVMLGLGEAHGAAAVAWTLKNLGRDFDTVVNGRPRRVRSLSDPKRVTLPRELRSRTAYRFNFSDQHTVRRTLGVPEAATRLCFDSRPLTGLLAALRRLGVWRLARYPLPGRLFEALFTRLRCGTDRFVVQVDAAGRLHGRAHAVTYAASGCREGEVTGHVAALVAEHLLTTPVVPGVMHLEHLLSLENLRNKLWEGDYEITLHLEPLKAVGQNGGPASRSGVRCAI